ncbi:hypothetical protein A8F94_05240 [Bacillus sp. FJAT-27225]|uniref:hypothetical protein n=1 Tax=Bacillus sp. FJAT-27225 TaxID=1743144 RepID=UPI00080C309D|nr:hypothetical protein [Bacillus sp. FJAT-27225]OCA91266.1 hypothetical protein A8F94_05240 [Bacillus sp. FJAT-27225]
MDTLVLGLGSLILLVPILYFLPLGLSAKGKIITLSFAAIVAIIAAYGVNIFGLWQMVLVITMFSAVGAYIMNGKLESSIYTEQVSSHDDYEEDLFHVAPDFSENQTTRSVHQEINSEEIAKPKIDATEEITIDSILDEIMVPIASGESPITPTSENDNPESLSFLDEIEFGVSEDNSKPLTNPASASTSPFDDESELQVLIFEENQSELPILELKPSKLQESSLETLNEQQLENEYLSAFLQVAAGNEKEEQEPLLQVSNHQ